MLLLTLIRTVMAAAAIVLVYRFSADDRAGGPGRSAWPDYVLANLLLISVVFHFGILMHPKPWVVVHEHDIFHYYLGSKYSPEIGYHYLYEAAAVAESENLGDDAPRCAIRRMDTYELVPNTEVVEDGDRYRALFTPERWEEFKGDVAVFRDGLGGRERWTIVLSDNGYNATPIWNMVARQITNRVSVQWPPGLLLLALFDTALLLLMFGAIWKSFGGRTALMAAVFLGSLVVMADGTIRGAFLRLDWLVLLVLATCALKRKRYKTAGALVACAAGIRVFPLVFVFGLGAKWVWDFLATRRVDRRYLEFFVVFALVVAVLFSLSLVTGAGMDGWKDFWTKIQFHDTRMSGLRVGFKTLFLAAAAPFVDNWPSTPAMRSARFSELKLPWWPLQALVLAGVFFAARRLEDYETIPLGWVLVYFLFAPTHYYQVVLLVLTLLFLPKLAERARAHGMALLFGISVATYLLWIRQNAALGFGELRWDRFSYTTSIGFAGLLLIAALYVLGFGIYTSLSSPPSPPSAAAATRDFERRRSDRPIDRG